MRVQVSKSGLVHDIEIFSDPSKLSASAIEAVNHWKYQPASWVTGPPVDRYTFLSVALKKGRAPKIAEVNQSVPSGVGCGFAAPSLGPRPIDWIVNSISPQIPRLAVPKNEIEREHLLDGQFKVVSKTEGIPANVKQAFSKVTRQTSFVMANPGQAFQVTDEGSYRKLPWRRLVFAGVEGGDWFLHYERGGLAHSYYVVALKEDSHGDARFVWGCGVRESAETLDQLRTMVATCQLAGPEGYW